MEVLLRKELACRVNRIGMGMTHSFLSLSLIHDNVAHSRAVNPRATHSYNFGRGLKERVFAKEQHFDALGICFPPRSGVNSKGDRDVGSPSEEKERDTVALRSL